MKTLIKQLFLVTILISSHEMSKQIRGFPLTPKGMDLSDHFGTEPVANVYGPKAAVVGILAREGITGEGTPITPINNFRDEINPTAVVSGDLENTSYDATKIIKPEIAGKKAILFANFFNHFSSQI